MPTRFGTSYGVERSRTLGSEGHRVLALLCLLAAQSPPPDPAGEPPPPPALLDEPAPGEGDGDAPTPAAVIPPGATPAPDVDAGSGPIVTRRRAALLPRPMAGGLAATAGAAFGAGLGAALVTWAAFVPGVDPWLLAIGAVTTPALASFFAGAAFVVFAIEEPIFEDLALVAGCTAVGCLSLALLAVGIMGPGSLCSIGSGCATPSPCCGGSPSPSSVDEGDGDEAALFAAGGGGVGAAVGLGVGLLVGLDLMDTPAGPIVPTLAMSAGAGLVIGAVAGGAVGGVLAGTRDDTSFARAQVRRRASSPRRPPPDARAPPSPTTAPGPGSVSMPR